MTEIRAFGTVQNDKLTLTGRAEFIEALRPLNGHQVEIIVRKAGRRSLPQNAYYFGGVLPIVRQGLKDAGYRMSMDEVHELMKFKFLLQNIVSEHGEMLTTIGSTRKLSKEEFTDYIEAIRQWAAEYLGVQVPEPNEQTTIPL